MTLEDVKSYWMRIATTNKASHDTSERYGRRKSGSKGIGRFSCRRLGPKLCLRTTALLEDGFYETTTVDIDWDQYAAGTNIDAIVCDGNTVRKQSGSVGTELIISGGSSAQWSHRGWHVLKRRLILLVSNRGSRKKATKPTQDLT
jgi:hypothetical protein